MSEQKVIRVTGQGQASRLPDQIEIKLNLTSLDKEYQQALAISSQKNEALQKALTELGYEKTALKTGHFQVTTKTDSFRDKNEQWQEVFLGYQVEQSLTLKIPLNMQKLGEILQQIVVSKTEPKMQLAFTLAHPEHFQGELLKSATEDAHRKAEILAGASGHRLGELQLIDYSWQDVHFSSDTIFEPRLMAASSTEMLALPDLIPADIEGQENVQFVWELV